MERILPRRKSVDVLLFLGVLSSPIHTVSSPVDKTRQALTLLGSADVGRLDLAGFCGCGCSICVMCDFAQTRAR